MVADAVPDPVAEISDVRSEHLGGTRIQALIIEHIARHGEEICPARSSLCKERVEVLNGEKHAEMHVADLRDHHAVCLGRQVRHRDGIVTAHRMVSLDKRTVATEKNTHRRVERRIFQHTPPRGIIGRMLHLSQEKSYQNRTYHKSKHNHLRHEQQDDRQRHEPRPAVRPMRAEQEEQPADTADLKECNADACRAKPPFLCQIAQEIDTEREQCEDDEQENHQEARQGYLLICQSPVIIETNGIVATEMTVESAMISVIRG